MSLEMIRPCHKGGYNSAMFCDISIFIVGRTNFTFRCQICTWLISVFLTSAERSLIMFVFTSLRLCNPY